MRPGFSLIEIIVFFVIIGILAAVSFPFYTRHVVNEKRFEAELSLIRISAAMEEYYLINNTYQNANLESLGFKTKTANGRYKLELKILNGSTFTLLAEPLDQQQALDTDCAVLGLDSQGKKSSSGKAKVSNCWV